MGRFTPEDVARKASEFGYQGLELACWGDHFDVQRALGETGYCAARRDLRSVPPTVPRNFRPDSSAMRSQGLGR